MTKEEAIKILDPETSREALLPYAFNLPKRLAVVTEAMRMGAESLRAGSDGAQVVHGKWVFNGISVSCSVCAQNRPDRAHGKKLSKKDTRFCCFCGAKMDEGVNP